jgi:hypothetical protein
MSNLPKGTTVRVMDWNSDYYMQIATVDAALNDGRMTLSQGGIRIGAFKTHVLCLLPLGDRGGVGDN